VAEVKKSRTEVYEAESKAAAGVADTKPATPKKAAKAEPKAAEPKAAEPKAAEPKAAESKPAEAAEPTREAVAETAEDPAGAGADAS
jgi:small subunit ribosomal protein S16